MSLGHGDKWGPLGSIFAALCCLGAAPALAALSALGLGFLIKDVILIPLLLFLLGVTIWALRRDRSRHGSAGPEWLAWLAALLTAGGLWLSSIVVGLGLVLLVSASIWNIIVTQPPQNHHRPVTGGGNKMSSLGKKLTPLFIFASLLALQRLAGAEVSPSGSQDVLKLTIIADTETNKALAWL